MIPSIPPYGRQLFICTNGNCASAETVAKLLQQLGALHRKHGLHRLSNPKRITHVPCGCLGVCINGPILVVYPDGIWYYQVDEERLNRIYEEHFLNGKPVDEYIFHRYFAPGDEPAPLPGPAEDSVNPVQLAAEASAAEKERQAQAERQVDRDDRVQRARQRRERRRSLRLHGG